jgi:hypothetical protein
MNRDNLVAREAAILYLCRDRTVYLVPLATFNDIPYFSGFGLVVTWNLKVRERRMF